MPYRVEVTKHASRALRALPKPLQARLFASIEALRFDPRPPGCKTMVGEHDLYRIRVGDYRVIYEVHDGELLIVVVMVGHRRDIYRRG